jgi:hypothetical protein
MSKRHTKEDWEVQQGQLHVLNGELKDCLDDIAIAEGKKADAGKALRAADKEIEECKGKRDGLLRELSLTIDGKGERLPFGHPPKPAGTGDGVKRADIPERPEVARFTDLGVSPQDFCRAYYPHLLTVTGTDGSGPPELTGVLHLDAPGKGKLEMPYIVIPPDVRAGGPPPDEFRLIPLHDAAWHHNGDGFPYAGLKVQMGPEGKKELFRLGNSTEVIHVKAPVKMDGGKLVPAPHADAKPDAEHNGKQQVLPPITDPKTGKPARYRGNSKLKKKATTKAKK